MDWLTGADFLTRGCCLQPGSHWGSWQYVLQLANLLTAIAYCYIPWILWLRAERVVNRLSKFTAYVFGAFIFLCGVHHIWEVLVWYWPAYKVFAIFDSLMAIVSFFAAFSAPVAVKALSRSPEKG